MRSWAFFTASSCLSKTLSELTILNPTLRLPAGSAHETLHDLLHAAAGVRSGRDQPDRRGFDQIWKVDAESSADVLPQHLFAQRPVHDVRQWLAGFGARAS